MQLARSIRFQVYRKNADDFSKDGQLAIAAERAQLRLIGYPLVDRARPLNQRVQRLPAYASAWGRFS